MTKIYLVAFSFTHPNKFDEFEVFTNQRKALAYKRYWDAVIKENNYKWIVEIKSLRINTYDYTKAAIKLETKELPY